MAETTLSNSCWLRFADAIEEKTKIPSGIPKINPTTIPAQNMAASS